MRNRANHVRACNGGSEPLKATAWEHGARLLGTVALVAIALATLWAFTSSALAKDTRFVESSFGAGELSLAPNSGVAIDEATEDAYVSDTGHDEVAQYEADGTPIRTFGPVMAPTFIAIDNSGGTTQGDVYVVASGEGAIWRFAANGTLESSWGTAGKLGGFSEIKGIAISLSGDLFVLSEENTVSTFDQAGAPVGAPFNAPRGTSAAGLTIDSEGNLYKVDGSPEVTKFSNTGTTITNSITGREGAVGLTVNPGNNDLYVVNGNGSYVGVYEVGCGGPEVSCTAKEEFGEGDLSTGTAVAANGNSGRIYVPEAGANQIKVFGPPVVIPDVMAEEATEIKAKTAILHGLLNPDGLAVTECDFVYSTGGGPSNLVPCEGAIPTDESNHPVAGDAAGLEPGTTYSVRLLAGNGNGSSGSTSVTFTTLSTATTEPADAITATSATLEGEVAPGGEAVTECVFEYGETEALGSSEPCVGETPPDEERHAVSAVVSGLNREKTYFYRLIVKQPDREEGGAIASFETAGAHTRAEAVKGVGLHEATLEAQIDPRGSITSYFFEYGAGTGYGQASPTESIGADEAFKPVAQTLTDLAPGTTYHWRIVVVDGFGEVQGIEHIFTTFSEPESLDVACPNQALRLGFGAWLPDCRAYEQVTPVKKDGGNIQGSYESVVASPDGDRITFFVKGGLPGGEGSQELPTFLAQRSEEQWSTQGLLAPALLGRYSNPQGLTEDLQSEFVSAGDRKATQNVYEKNTFTRKFTEVLKGQGELSYADNSANDTYILFTSRVGGTHKLLLRARATGDLIEPGVMNDGQTPELGVVPGPYQWFGEGTRPYLREEHVLSEDGQRVIFTDLSNNQLYMRTNPFAQQSAMNGGDCVEPGKACTIEVSASHRSTPDPGGPQPAKFVTATRDGRYVFFMSSSMLTEDAYTVSDSSPNLYRFDSDTGALKDLTPAGSATSANGPEVAGLLGISGDGSYVYFAAGGSLASGAGPGECSQGIEPVGPCNVFLWHEGTINYVTTLANSRPASFWMPANWALGNNNDNTEKTGMVSEGGQTLIFQATGDLTNYQSAGYLEFYRYRPGHSGVTCLTCSPTGEPPTADATLRSISGGFTGVSIGMIATARNMSSDGSRFFFESNQRLVGGDTNGVKDVYEWESPDESSSGWCAQTNPAYVSSADGCLFLISSGKSVAPSYFGDASSDGGDVFFFTNQPLVGQDQDELVDIYDAHVDGGIAVQNPSSSAQECGGESCLGARSAGVTGSTAGTANFVGPGNPRASSCKKGYVRKSGRCVKKRKKHKSKAKSNRARRRGGGADSAAARRGN